MHEKIIVQILCALGLLLPVTAPAQILSPARQFIISRSLDTVEARNNRVVSDTYHTEGRSAYEPEERNVGQSTSSTQRPSARRDDSLAEVRDFVFGDAQSNVSFGFQRGRINGSTSYRTSFDNSYEIGGHGESELEWPLDNTLIGLSAALHYKSNKERPFTHDRFRLGLLWFTGGGKNAGDMKDSDWIENDVGYIDYNDGGGLNGSSGWASNNDGLDIYSESPVKLDQANIFDINYVYNLWIKDHWAIGPVLGYHYQSFKFSVYSVNQVGYGPYGPGPFDQSYKDDRGLKWADYKATYYVPYIGLNSELNLSKRFSLLLNVGYSDWVSIKDKDSHLYPTEDEDTGINHDMVSPGHSKGRAYLFGSEGNWQLTPRWSLNAGANYVSIHARGYMTQEHYYDGVLTGVSDPVAEKIKSQYWLINAALKYKF